MANKTVSVDGLADALEGILEEYSVEVVKATNEAVEMTAQEGVKELRKDSRAKFKSNRRGHKYARGWRMSRESSSLGDKSFTIYNTEYQLTHLLELGHVMWFDRENKSARAIPHISPVAEKLGKKIDDFFKRGLSKI